MSYIHNTIFTFPAKHQVAYYSFDVTTVFLKHLLNYSSNVKRPVNVQTIHFGFIVILEHLFNLPEKVLMKTYWKQALIQIVIQENIYRFCMSLCKEYNVVIFQCRYKQRLPAGANRGEQQAQIHSWTGCFCSL